jgi:hypothetical protein
LRSVCGRLLDPDLEPLALPLRSLEDGGALTLDLEVEFPAQRIEPLLLGRDARAAQGGEVQLERPAQRCPLDRALPAARGRGSRRRTSAPMWIQRETGGKSS